MTTSPPSWVRAADGRLEPFDSGRICRSLFAAAEAIGRPDPFTARELADGVAFFLAGECEGETPAAARIAEVTAKTVRELGHPALAAAYEARLPRAEEMGYSRDVLAAHASGLIRLDDVARPAARLLPGHAAGIINRNVAAPPDAGPLFPAGPARLPDLAVHAEGVASSIDWHVNDLADLAPTGEVDAFVFDRPGRPPALGAGVDQQHPAALARVCLDLPALARRPGLLADEGRFLLRLAGLAGIALDAGVQKRAHLRRLGDLSGGFVLERARLVVEACGLDECVRLFTGWGLANAGPSLALGRRIVERLRDALRAGRLLEPWLVADVAGGEGMSVRARLHAAASIHAACDGGTLHLDSDEGRPAVLRDAYERTGIHRIVFR